MGDAPRVPRCDPRRLVAHLKRSQTACKLWARTHKRPNEVLAACDAVTELVDLLEEHHALTTLEFLLRSLVTARRSSTAREMVVYWKQCFSLKLCKLGDENTTFLHASASACLRSNKIPVLDDRPAPVYTHVGKERLLHAFYTQLLGADVPSTCRPLYWRTWTPSPVSPRLRHHSPPPKIRKPFGKCVLQAAPAPTASAPRSTVRSGLFSKIL